MPDTLLMIALMAVAFSIGFWCGHLVGLLRGGAVAATVREVVMRDAASDDLHGPTAARNPVPAGAPEPYHGRLGDELEATIPPAHRAPAAKPAVRRQCGLCQKIRRAFG